MIHALSMLFSVVLIKCIEKLTQRTFMEDDFHFDGIKFPADNDTDKFEELNQNVSVNMFEVDDENGQTIISRKLKNNAECHIDALRIDEDDNSHYVYIKCCKQTFTFTKKVNFVISLTFANIVIMSRIIQIL